MRWTAGGAILILPKPIELFGSRIKTWTTSYTRAKTLGAGLVPELDAQLSPSGSLPVVPTKLNLAKIGDIPESSAFRGWRRACVYFTAILANEASQTHITIMKGPIFLFSILFVHMIISWNQCLTFVWHKFSFAQTSQI